MDSNYIGVIMVTILAGGLLTIFGYSIKHFKAIDLVLSFDETKHDKEKVIKTFGNNILVTGLIILIIGVVGIFVIKNFLGIIMSIQMIILILNFLFTVFRLNTYCKK